MGSDGVHADSFERLDRSGSEPGHLLRLDPTTLGVVADAANGAAGATLLGVRPD